MCCNIYVVLRSELYQHSFWWLGRMERVKNIFKSQNSRQCEHGSNLPNSCGSVIIIQYTTLCTIAMPAVFNSASYLLLRHTAEELHLSGSFLQLDVCPPRLDQLWQDLAALFPRQILPSVRPLYQHCQQCAAPCSDCHESHCSAGQLTGINGPRPSHTAEIIPGSSICCHEVLLIHAVSNASDTVLFTAV